MSPEEFDEVSRFVDAVGFDAMVSAGGDVLSSRGRAVGLGGHWAPLGPVAGC